MGPRGAAPNQPSAVRRTLRLALYHLFSGFNTSELTGVAGHCLTWPQR